MQRSGSPLTRALSRATSLQGRGEEAADRTSPLP